MTTTSTSKAWADTIRLPNETDEQAMKRRVTMHEFLMTGGVASIDPTTHRTVYSEPITDPDDYIYCPFHDGLVCTAWDEIREGRGYWTKMEAELAELERHLDDNGDDEDSLIEQVTELREKLADRPMGLVQSRIEQVAKPRTFAAAGPKKGPFPWSTASNDGAPKVSHSKPPVNGYDARNVVEAAAQGLAPDSDVIEIDGEE